MNAINGQPYSYYGIIFSKSEGLLNMPSRLGDVVYDWGDFIQPLVDEEDIYWKAREFKIDVLFDGNRHGINLKEALSRLSALPKEFLLNTDYGDFTVNLKNVVKSKEYAGGGFAKLKLVFSENDPQFTNNSLGTSVGGNGVLIDGFDLYNDFEILVSDVKLIDNIPLLKQSNITVFENSKPYTGFRKLDTIQLSCAKLYSDKNQLRETTEKFKKLLSQKGYRILTYKNKNYNCFISEGFAVRVYRNHIKFNLKLNLTANFVEEGFVLPGFVN